MWHISDMADKIRQTSPNILQKIIEFSTYKKIIGQKKCLKIAWTSLSHLSAAIN